MIQSRQTEPAKFPSDENLKHLRQKLRDGNFSLNALTDEERWYYYAYDYGFRRVKLRTRDDMLPTDLDHDWRDQRLAVMAEAFYSRKLGLPRPDLGPAGFKPEPTPEEVAHVERCVRQILGNIGRWDRRNRAVFAGPRPLLTPEEYQRELGVSATPSRWQNDDAVRDDAALLGLGEANVAD